MPFRLQAVPGTAFFMYQAFQATLYPDFVGHSILWDVWWDREYRGLTTKIHDEFSFNNGGRWPNRTSFVSDPAYPCSLMFERELGNMSVGNYAPWHFGFGGCQSSKFIMGQCKRADETPIGGAVVQCYRTSDDMFVSETTTDDNGRYECKCPNTPTDQHYLVAYYNSAIDLAGTTVNTLIPTYRDGTT